MFKRFLIATMVVFASLSCSIDDSGKSDARIETLAVKSAIVPAIFELGSTYIITVTYDLPTSCHLFFDIYYQYDGTSRIVAVNALVNTSPTATCAAVVTEGEHSFKVVASQTEDYTFRFWKGKDADGQDIFEDIVVPVSK